MKKAVIWMIAAMMLMGSLKVFASEDVTAGKLDAVAQDRLENDIQADITEGKIQAAMADMEQEKVVKKLSAQVIESMNLQSNFEQEDPDKLIKGFGDVTTLAQWTLNDIQNGRISIKDAKEVAADLEEEMIRLKEIAKPYIH